MSGDYTPKIGDIVAVPMMIDEITTNGTLILAARYTPDRWEVPMATGHGPIPEPKGGAE